MVKIQAQAIVMIKMTKQLIHPEHDLAMLMTPLLLDLNSENGKNKKTAG
jgi:hypothetical protein